MEYPCDKCGRKNKTCNYSVCNPWRLWFLNGWGRIHAYGEKALPLYYKENEKQTDSD